MRELPTCLVTGAAGGMGRAVVDLLLARGANVVATDRTGVGLGELAHAQSSGYPGRLACVEADAADPASLSQAVAAAEDRWGGVDGVFNVAGIAKSGTLLDMTLEEYDHVMAVNARSMWWIMKLTVPSMLERGGGRIVNTGSIQSSRGSSGFSAYAASKHAIVGMTKSVALEYAARNIVANVLCPGAMNTPMVDEALRFANSEDLEGARRAALGTRPQGRFAEPVELAETGVWLLLDAPSHLSGQVITVDGAATAR